MDQQAVDKALGTASSQANKSSVRPESLSPKANGDVKLAAGHTGAASAAS
jgi:hypothetical protein